MPALTVGKAAPEVSLPDTDGRRFSLRDALQRGPVVLAFFKVTCPVCQYAMPFVERIYQAHKGRVVAISQHPNKETQMFMREYGITMPVLLDDPDRYAVSNAYGLTNVPTIFLISTGGEVEISCVGWSKKDLEAINRYLSQAASAPPAPLFHRGEDVIDYKPG
jgi:peroxiredoxin